jgi:hypothetical protein
VRVAPVVGDKVWFAPRRIGWGLSPVSVEGWAVTLGMVGVGMVAARRRDLPGWSPHVLMVLLLILTVLKGTSPGGAGARSRFEEARATGASAVES